LAVVGMALASSGVALLLRSGLAAAAQPKDALCPAQCPPSPLLHERPGSQKDSIAYFYINRLIFRNLSFRNKNILS